jgi:AraC family transcriptional regulator of adaptative response/methylated-DNA-[protein]-cysteine methyltransferase
MKQLTREEMLRAFRMNDASYDGKFYIGVKTTGIFCLPSCRAKLPLVENITFFANREEAIAGGFRGCLRCRAESYPDVLPPWLKDVLTLMADRLTGKIDEHELVELAGVDISTIRRYFRNHLKTTPMAYHRKLRLAHAKLMLKNGADYLTVAYECGFESASGFRDAFIREYGLPPGGYNAERSNRL